MNISACTLAHDYSIGIRDDIRKGKNREIMSFHVHKVYPSDSKSLWHGIRYVVTNCDNEWLMDGHGNFRAYRSRSSAYSWIYRDHREAVEWVKPVAR